jgi:hypothetical protein
MTREPEVHIPANNMHLVETGKSQKRYLCVSIMAQVGAGRLYA